MKFDLTDPPWEIRKALNKVTTRSTHKRHMTGCVIVDKSGNIISNGCSHASSFRMTELHSIHAEIHAVGRGRHIDLKGAVAIVQTKARKSGNIVSGMPCLTCAIAMESVGINTVVYSVNNNKFSIVDLEQDISHLKVYPKRRSK